MSALGTLLVPTPVSSHANGLTELAELNHASHALETLLQAVSVWGRPGGSGAGCLGDLWAMPASQHWQPPLQLASGRSQDLLSELKGDCTILAVSDTNPRVHMQPHAVAIPV